LVHSRPSKNVYCQHGSQGLPSLVSAPCKYASETSREGCKLAQTATSCNRAAL
jgi:hypothetical protein